MPRLRLKKSAHHLVLKPSGYHFRIRVPEDLQARFGRGEIRLSLRTSELSRAREASNVLSTICYRFFKTYRKNMKELSDTKLHELLEKYLREALQEAEEERALAERPLRPEELDQRLETLEFLIGETREALALNDYKSTYVHVDGLLEDNSLELNQASDSYRKLCREFLKIRAQFLETEHERALGVYPPEQRAVKRLSQAGGMAASAVSGPSSVMREVIASYVRDHTHPDNRRWTSKTEATALAVLDLFIEIVGNRQVTEVDRVVMREYKDKLVRLPANLHKNPDYRGKSIDEVLAMSDLKPMSVSSINKNITWVSSLLKWCVRHGYLLNNPAEGLTLKKSKRPDEERSIFTHEDLQHLFNGDAKFRFPYQRWMPLLGLYTGARLEELAQLHREDVYKTNGVWVIHVRPGKGRTLKTRAAERMIPVHTELQRRGFLELVSQGRDERLFPKLTKGRDGYGTAVSKWFRRHRHRVGVTAPGKVFHSFRHGFATTLKQADVPEHAIAELLGHEHDQISTSRYGKRHEPAKLVEWIELVRYPI